MAVHNETAAVEQATVEGLIRLTHRSLERAGHVVSPARVSKTVRRAFRQVGPTAAAMVIENWIRDLSRSPDFNSDVLLPLTYADPTGDTAARRIDRERSRTKTKAPEASTPEAESHQ
jgi:hypothetical protein